MEWTLDELEKAFASLEADSAAETAEPETTGTVVTGGSRLNLRSGGSTDYAVIGQLAPDDQVRVLGEENGWYEVLITEKRGYVCGKYLRVEETEPPAAAEGDPGLLDEQSLMLFLSLMMQGMTGAERNTGALTPEGNLTLVDDLTGNAPEPEPDPEPEKPETKKKSGSSGLLVLALAGGGAVYYLKFMKKKPEAKGSTDLDDYDYGDDEDELEEDTDPDAEEDV